MRAVIAALLGSILASGCGGGSKPAETSTPTDGEPSRLHVDVEVGNPLPASTFRRGSGSPSMKGVPFRLADLPTFVPSKEQKGTERRAPEIKVTRTGAEAVLTVPRVGGRLARLMLDETSNVSQAGLRVTCGKWAAARLSLAMLDIREDGTASFTRSDGIFDASACEAVERSRVTFQPAALVPGYLFAYRTCTAAPCESGREIITFLMPPLVELESEGLTAGSMPASPAPMGVASFEISRGSFGTMTAVVNEAALASLFSERPTWLDKEPVVLGIDIATTTEEKEPVALASFGQILEGPPDRSSRHEFIFH